MKFFKRYHEHIIVAILIVFKMQIDELTNSLMDLSGGACFLESGKCIHEQNLFPFIIGAVAILLTLGVGIYLVLFSKTEKSFETAQKNILSKISSAKNKELKEEKQ